MDKTRGSLRIMIERVKFLTGDTYNPFVSATFGTENKQTGKLQDVKADVFFNEKLCFEVNGDEELKSVISVHSKGFFGEKQVGQATLGLDMYFEEKDKKHKTIVKIYDGDKVPCEVTVIVEFCYSFLGTMHVLVKRAELIRDTEIFGKMDPFVIVQLGDDQKKQTSVKDNAGKTPVWDEKYSFDLMNLFDSLKVIVMDEEVGKADHIGEGVCDFKPMSKSVDAYTVPVSHKGQAAGVVYLEISFSK